MQITRQRVEDACTFRVARVVSPGDQTPPFAMMLKLFWWPFHPKVACVTY
jgi:hypothetical protein